MKAFLRFLRRVFLFGSCPHGNTTFPMTPTRRFTGDRPGTYVVCLDCGAKFDYDWSGMKRGAELPETPAARIAAYEGHDEKDTMDWDVALAPRPEEEGFVR